MLLQNPTHGLQVWGEAVKNYYFQLYSIYSHIRARFNESFMSKTVFKIAQQKKIVQNSWPRCWWNCVKRDHSNVLLLRVFSRAVGSVRPRKLIGIWIGPWMNQISEIKRLLDRASTTYVKLPARIPATRTPAPGPRPRAGHGASAAGRPAGDRWSLDTVPSERIGIATHDPAGYG